MSVTLTRYWIFPPLAGTVSVIVRDDPMYIWTKEPPSMLRSKKYETMASPSVSVAAAAVTARASPAFGCP